jgi:hypothetical protein
LWRSHEPPKTITIPHEPIKRAVEALVALIRRGEVEPPVRPHVFTIEDEHGVERKMFAPSGPTRQRFSWAWALLLIGREARVPAYFLIRCPR